MSGNTISPRPSRYRRTNTPPPLAPTSYGNFQMLPSPMAEPIAARMKPARLDQYDAGAAIGSPYPAAASGRPPGSTTSRVTRQGGWPHDGQ